MIYSLLCGRNILSCLSFFLVLSVIVHTANASSPIDTRPFPLTGAFTAEFVEDRDQIAIMNFAGNYDKKLASGEFNLEARSVVAKEFFRTHPDQYDFLVVFSSFEFDTGDALAFYLGVKNDIKGIGRAEFDNTQLFGSDGKLQGFIDMAALNRYELDPLKPNFDKVLSVLSHETMHRWGSFVKYKNSAGDFSDSLLGHQDAHWSYKLDSSASVMYGADWRDNKDGSFTSAMTRKFFSPLDLYLMGIYGASEVPPFMVIQNDEIDKEQFPKLNDTIAGSAEIVTIDQIIEAEGVRVPGIADSQKDFRFGFVLLKGDDTNLSEHVITGLSNLRKEFKTRFAAMTGGRAKIHVYPTVISEASTGLPDEVQGGEYRGSVNVSDALNWISNKQKPEGYWEDNESTRLRDTAVGMQVLADLLGPSVGIDSALSWIDQDIHPQNTDFLSRKLQILIKNKMNFDATKSKLLLTQNSDGGWGLSEGHDSDPFDTALALQALTQSDGATTSGSTSKAISFLLNNKNPDGSWGTIISGPGRINVTTNVLNALKLSGVKLDNVISSLEWIASKQKADGSFGSAQGTIHETAQVVNTFIDFGIIDQINAHTAIAFISERQDDAGSWNGSVYTTSVAVRVLKRFNFANLTVEFVKLHPEEPFDGQSVNIELRIQNLGNTLADLTSVRLYDGDPASDGVVIGSDIALPIMPSGGSVLTSFTWDTINNPGQHKLFAVVDPNSLIDELAEYDNQASILATVKSAPETADLVINNDSIIVTPAKPDYLPAPIGVILQVRNIGKVDVTGIHIALLDGGVLVDEQVADIQKRSSVAVNLSYILNKPGIKKLKIFVDSANIIEEVNENDNLAEVTIETLDSLDFEILTEDIRIMTDPVYLGDDIKFNITLRNRGTKSTPMTDVKFMVFDGEDTITVDTQPLQLAAGESTQREVIWRSSKSGSLNLVAEIDNLNMVPESNEANNAASSPFSVGMVSGPNLMVSHNDLLFSPDPAMEGYGVTLNALIRNTGSQDASSVTVAFYDGNPLSGGNQIGGNVVIPALAAGESLTLNHVWSKIPDLSDHVVFVVVDPDDEISEFSEDDNRAFNLLTVKGLPDFVITDEYIRIEPAFPRPGDTVLISCSVQNAGSQSATDIAIRAYQGEPSAGGIQIDTEKTISLDGFEQKVVSFSHTVTESLDLSQIVIYVDPTDSILEKREDNNVAIKQFSIQNADTYVTEPYFSPNGDGIKDETVLSYRLQSSAQVQLLIENEKQEIVFIKELGEVTNGQFLWDGTDQKSRIVRDGSYRFKIVNKLGQTLGESWSVVDNNRSPLADSIGTEFEYVKNLTCDYRFSYGQDFSRTFMMAKNESWNYLVNYEQILSDSYGGISRMRRDGSGIERVASGNDTQPAAEYFTMQFISSNGEKIAYTNRIDGVRNLFVSDGNGENAVLIDSGFYAVDAVAITEDNEKIYWWKEYNGRKDDFFSASISSPQNKDLLFEGKNLESPLVEYSPDYSKIYFTNRSHMGNNNSVPPTIYNFETGETYELSGNDALQPEWISFEYKYHELNWSPSGKYLVQKIAPHNDLCGPQPASVPMPVDSIFTTDDIKGVAIYSNTGELLTKINSLDFSGDSINIRNLTWIDEDKGTVAIAVQILSGESGVYELNIHTGEKRKIISMQYGEVDCDQFDEFSYHISTWDGAQWVKRGELHYGSSYSTQTLDLKNFLPDADGENKVRISQLGHEIAAIEQVGLFSAGSKIIRPTSAIDLLKGQDITESLTQSDNHVFEAHGGNIEVKWDGDISSYNLKLVMAAKESTLSDKEFLPLTFPQQPGANYSYVVADRGKFLVDGKQTEEDNLPQPLFNVFSKPDTGAPYADVHGYVTSDLEYIYASLDLTVDNTLELILDQASIVVSTDTGSRTYTVSPSSTANGVVGLGLTEAVTYPHLYYEFKIPFADIGISLGDIILVRFETQGSVGKLADSDPLMVVVDEDGIKQGSEGQTPLLSLSKYSTLIAIPGSNALAFRSSNYSGEHQTVIINTNDGSVKPFLEDYNFGFPRSHYQPLAEFSDSGSSFFFKGKPLNANPSDCKINENVFAMLSLLNMTTDLRATSSGGAGGVILQGTIADRNLDYYTIEYSDDAYSESWSQIQGPSTQPIVDGYIATWIPPREGQYRIKLTAIDKAGNSRSEIINVVWNEVSPITELNREPEYFSPNGDGVYDLLNLSYRVNMPLHVEIAIYNDEGNRVRNITRDHSTIGELIEVSWDGRDDGGIIVSDGVYRIEVLDFELYVNLDNTFPDVSLLFNDPFAELDAGYDGYISVNPSVEIIISDDNGNGAQLLHQNWLASPGEWTLSSSWIDPDLYKHFEADETGSFAHLITRKWKVEARDKAGNKSNLTTDFVPQRIVLHRIINSDPTYFYCEEPGFDSMTVNTRSNVFVDYSKKDSLSIVLSDMNLFIAETIRDPLAYAEVQYRLKGSKGLWGAIALDSFNSLNDVVVNDVPLESSCGVAPRKSSTVISDHRWLSNTNMEVLQPGQEYEIRIRAKTNLGDEYISNISNIKSNSFKVMDYLLSKEGPVIAAEHGFGSELKEAKLYLSSQKDPRYERPKAFGFVLEPKLNFSFDAGELMPCTDYQVYMLGRMANGITRKSSPKTITTGCMYLEVFEPQPAKPQGLACGQSDKRLQLEFVFDLFNDSKLTSFIIRNNKDQVLLSENFGSVKLAYPSNSYWGNYDVLLPDISKGKQYYWSTEIDTSIYPHGENTFIATLRNNAGEEYTRKFRVYIDHKITELDISYPVEQQKVCGTPVEFEQEDGSFKTQNSVQIRGSLLDEAWSSVFAYKSDYDSRRCIYGYTSRGELIINDCSTPTYINSKQQSGYYPQRKSFLNRSESFDIYWQPADKPETWSELKYPYAVEPGVTGVDTSLGYITGYSGNVNVKVSSIDYGNAKQCDAVSFEVDTIVDGANFVISEKIISPANQDGIKDQVIAAIKVAEPANIDISIKPATKKAKGGFSVSNSVVNELATDIYLPGGSADYQWNGTNSAGDLVSDGWYAIVVSFTDGCNLIEEHIKYVEIDNTKPSAIVTYPTNVGPYPTIIDILGSVDDKNLDGYSLSYGVGKNPETWSIIGEGSKKVIADSLESWVSYGLNGEHQLKLVANDIAANESIVLIDLDFQERRDWVSDLSAEPKVFSPNDDDKLDQTSVRFAVTVDSIVTLEVRDYKNELIRTIEEDVETAQGSYVRSWDGKNNSSTLVADGDYKIVLSVYLPADVGNIQVEEYLVSVDTAAPNVSISRPDQYVEGIGDIIGSVEDLHLNQFTISISEDLDAIQWTEIYKSDEEHQDSKLGSLENYQDGKYIIKVEAEDDGENITDELIPFIVDNTAPEITLFEPAENSIISAINGNMMIIGDIAEENIDRYVVEYGAGSDPQDWTIITSVDDLPTDSILTTWDIEAIPDGEYTLRITAIDKVSHENESIVHIKIDSTPPDIEISSIVDGSYLNGTTEILGTVVDPNFSNYELNIASGVKGSSERWTQIGVGDQEVTDGILWNWGLLPVDGVYTLKLNAQDLADNKAEKLLQITIDTVPLELVNNLIASAEKAGDLGNVTLSWDELVSEELSGYAIYRNGTRINEAIEESITYIDLGLPQGEYSYQISSIDKAGNESELSTNYTIIVDFMPPMVEIHTPSNDSVISGQIDISGTAKGSDDFNEYQVYIGEGQAPSNWNLIRKSSVPAIANDLAQLSTYELTDGATYSIKLEATDISGNIASTVVTVEVDNLAPEAPTGLSVTTNVNTANLTWNAVDETDLLGYILFRNDRIANSSGVVIGDVKTFAIGETVYADIDLPDGNYIYSVAAIDKSGNLSPVSGSVEAAIDIRAPQAVITKPELDTQFDKSLFIKATSDDTDIASVLFQYQKDGVSTWTDIGISDLYSPYEAVLDVQGIDYGVYKLRSIATDNTGKTDSNPVETQVEYKDISAPATPSGFVYSVDGGSVNLAWEANSETDLAGYHVYRRAENGTQVQITIDPLQEPAYTDTELPDGVYYYSIKAVDTTDNQSSSFTAEAKANIYTPSIIQPYTPRLDNIIEIEGAGEVNSIALITITNSLGSQSTYAEPTDNEGWFLLNEAFLEVGENVIEVKVEDSVRNLSKILQTHVVVGEMILPPTGLSASIADYDVSLDWDDHSNTSAIGYRAYRDGISVLPETIPVAVMGVDSRDQLDEPELAIDGDELSYWQPTYIYSGTERVMNGQWLELTLTQPEFLSHLDVTWQHERNKASDYDIQAYDGSIWVTIQQAIGKFEKVDSFTFAQPYYTNKIRIVLRKTVRPAHYYGSVRLAELVPYAIPLIRLSELTDSVQDGTYKYSVSAVTDLGFETAPSENITVEVGDVLAPDPVSLAHEVFGSEVQLSWSVSTADDLDHYEVYRNDKKIIDINAGINNYSDTGVVNGTYNYSIKVADAIGNISEPSNIEMVTVLVDVLELPASLNIALVAEGSALQLSWQDSIPVPLEYRVYRSIVPGGPYQFVSSTPDATWQDQGLTNGTNYYYVVVAVDSIGNESPYSNEVSAAPVDSVAPDSPQMLSPSIFGDSVSTENEIIDLYGLAEPASKVFLIKDGSVIRQTITGDLFESDQRQIETKAISSSGRYILANEYDLNVYDYEKESSLETIAFPSIYNVRRVDKSDDLLVHSYGNGVLLYSPAKNNYEYLIDGYINISWFNYVESAQMLMIYGYHNGANGFWSVDPKNEQWQLMLETSNLYGKPSASIDGKFVAYATTNPETGLVILNANSGSTELIQDANVNTGAEPVWHHDGTKIIFRSKQDDTLVLKYYDTSKGQLDIIVTDLSENYMDVSWSPDGSEILYVDSQQRLVRRNLSSGLINVVLDTGETFTNYHWTYKNTIVVGTTSDKTYWFTMPGSFEFADIDLSIGDNIFTAYAIDASENRSSTSSPLNIIYKGSNYSDLSISEADIKIIPIAPVIGENARVGVQIHNNGAVTSKESTLTLSVIGDDGVSQTISESTVVPEIPAGMSRTIAFDWQAPETDGSYLFVAVVDPFDEIKEQSEANNMALREVVVTGQGGLSLTLDLVGESIDINSDLSGIINLRNNGETFAGRVVIQLEDTQGYGVEKLYDHIVENLAYSDSLYHEITWNSGTTYAGNYQVHVSIFDDTGSIVNELIEPFEISGSASFESALSTDKKYYRGNQQVKVSGGLVYSSGNQMLEDVTVKLQVVSPNETVLKEDQIAVGALLPNAQNNISMLWNTGYESIGIYTAIMTVEHDGKELVKSVSTFDVIPGAQQVGGVLSLSDSVPSAGANIQANYTITNEGNIDISGLPLTLKIIDPMTQSEKMSYEAVISVAVNGSEQSLFEIATDELSLQAYGAILQTQIEDDQGELQTVILNSKFFTVVDRQAPDLSFVTPASDSVTGSDANIQLRAADTLSGVTSVSLSVDGGEYIQLAIKDASQYIYGTLLTELTEGQHQLEAKASDAAGNIVAAVMLTFTVDSSLPVITITGVTDNSYYNYAVSPQVTIVDSQLATSSIALNGHPFVSGTSVSEEGGYSLSVYAVDLAGNESVSQLWFYIDKTAPSIVVTGVENGAIYNNPVQAFVEVIEDNLYQTTIEINGLPYISGAVITADGNYELVVSSEDRAGNTSQTLMTFTVDATPPDAPQITQPQDGATIDGAATNVIGTTESNAIVKLTAGDYVETTIATDSGQFSFGNVPLIEGTNVINVQATDVAGNESEVSHITVTARISGDIEIEASINTDQDARVLIWIPGWKHPHCPKESNGLVELLEDTLKENGIDHLVVRNEWGFRDALRSQRYNQVIVGDLITDRGGVLSISLPTQLELRANVASGTGMTLITTHPVSTLLWKSVFGVRTRGTKGNLDYIDLDDSPASEDANHSTSGFAAKFKLSGGIPVGELHFKRGRHKAYPGLILNTYGNGPVAIIPFNPDKIIQRESAKKIVMDVVKYTTPTQGMLIPGSMAMVNWQVSGISEGASIKFLQTMNSPLSLVWAGNGGNVLDSTTAAWELQSSLEQENFQSLIQLPNLAGSYGVNTELFLLGDGNPSLLEEGQIDLTTDYDQSGLGVRLMDALNNMDTSNYFDEWKRQVAMIYAQYAITREQNSPADAEYSIGMLINAEIYLIMMRDNHPEVVALLGDLLRTYQARAQ